MTDKTINYLGIARKAGKLAAGEQAVGAVAQAGRARLLLIASDASPSALRRANSFITGKRTVLLKIPLTKEELSRAIGSGSCAMAAVTDIGLAANIAKALAAEPGGAEYGQAAELLSARNAKAIRRRRDKKKSRKNDKIKEDRI